MKRLLQNMSKRDWMLVIGGLAVVMGLQMAERIKPPQAPAAQVEQTMPAETPVPTALPPSPDGLADDAYHLRAAPAEEVAQGRSAMSQLDPGHDAVVYGPSARIALYHSLPSDAVRADFDKLMQGAAYFGAFAVAGNQAYGWTTGYATQAAARAAALAFCGQHATDCRIAAELLPADLTGEAPANTLSYEQAQAYSAIRAGQGPRALALSVDGAWSYTSADAMAEAIATVLRNCEAARGNRAGFLPKMPCRVFATWE